MVVGLLIGFLLLSGILTAVQKYPVKGMEKDIGKSTLGAFLADNFDVVIPRSWIYPRRLGSRIGETR
ncbi:MAG: hypothetical protein CM1200mP22_07790 [Dehalococcoidia bacterium]|nr:MAG: hypothetical protein CM1200mP22_07790 [Dehalococcoidia bacterium]